VELVDACFGARAHTPSLGNRPDGWPRQHGGADRMGQ
jgi:hypothetical protein